MSTTTDREALAAECKRAMDALFPKDAIYTADRAGKVHALRHAIERLAALTPAQPVAAPACDYDAWKPGRDVA